MTQKGSKYSKSDNFYYRKAARGITKWKAKQKSPVFLCYHDSVTILSLINQLKGTLLKLQSTKILLIPQKGSKESKSDNFYYRKAGRGITKWEAKEKSSIFLCYHGSVTILSLTS